MKFLCFSLLPPLSSPLLAFAQDAILSKVHGPVFLPRRRRGQGPEARRAGKSPIYGDAVRTGPGGTAHVLINGRGAVLLGENTAFMLQGTPVNTTLRFTIGEFLIGLRKKLESNESFRMRTPSSVAAVRGHALLGVRPTSRRPRRTPASATQIAVTAKGKTVLVQRRRRRRRFLSARSRAS